MTGQENQAFQESIAEVIKKRKSIRNYKAEVLTEELKAAIKDYAVTLQGPFDKKVRFELVDYGTLLEETGGKIGTYGVIKGAKAYIAGIIEKGEKDLEQLGYVFEKIILYATFLGLGTCWLGGTFKREEFQKILDLKENEILPTVTPIGYIEEKKGVLDSVMRLAVGSNNRKEWRELFFHQSFNSPLEETETAYTLPLEMVRLAPSASNKQPWRIVKDKKAWHFYLCPTKGYGKALGFNIQRIDIGIAMCHFEMTARSQGLEGNWKVKEKSPMIEGAKEEIYIVSWIEA